MTSEFLDFDLHRTLKIKRLVPEAVMPRYATPGSAGMDLTAISAEPLNDGELIRYRTGLAFEIPTGFVGLIFPRSSIYKTGQQLTNCVGVIDSDYRGEVSFIFSQAFSTSSGPYKVGDRVGQLVLMWQPDLYIEEVTELSDTARGTGGFGSTGR